MALTQHSVCLTKHIIGAGDTPRTGAKGNGAVLVQGVEGGLPRAAYDTAIPVDASLWLQRDNSLVDSENTNKERSG